MSYLETTTAEKAAEEFISSAKQFGFSDFEALLTTGADDRSLILKTGSNKVRSFYFKNIYIS